MTREQYLIRRATERRQAFLDAVRPLEQLKGRILQCSMPTIIVHPDGHTEYLHACDAQLAECDRVIDQIANAFLGCPFKPDF